MWVFTVFTHNCCYYCCCCCCCLLIQLVWVKLTNSSGPGRAHRNSAQHNTPQFSSKQQGFWAAETGPENPRKSGDLSGWWTELKKSVIFESWVVVENNKQPICEAQFSWVTRTSFVIIRSHKKVSQTVHLAQGYLRQELQRILSSLLHLSSLIQTAIIWF